MAYEEHFLLERIAETEAGGAGEPVIVNSTSLKEYSNPNAQLYIVTTAVTGTDPTLNIFLTKKLVSPSGLSINYRVHNFFNAITIGSLFTFEIANCPDVVTANWDIGGTDTPTFTFTVFLIR